MRRNLDSCHLASRQADFFKTLPPESRRAVNYMTSPLFGEATNARSLAWRRLPDQRPAIAQLALDIIYG